MDRVVFSLNGLVVWRTIFWRKDLDGGAWSRPKQALASMEQQHSGRDHGRKGKREGGSSQRNDRGDREAPLDIFRTENGSDLWELEEWFSSWLYVSFSVMVCVYV